MSTPESVAAETVNFYRPDPYIKTPDMRSPDYVQMSTAAAITLGLVRGWMHRTDCTHCLNLLVTYPEGCRANCSYCGLARHREESQDYADRNFIRVDWPTARYEDVIQRVRDGADRGRFERMCISMITHPDSDADTLTLLKRWVEAVPDIPASILSNPTSMSREDLVQLKEAGAQIFTVALDAATPQIFEHTRGATVDSPHRWDKYWETLEWAAEIYGPKRFGVHLICGMGETEQEMLEVCQRVRDMGGHNHLFAFFPEQGSLMEDWSPVPRAQWRRVQLARYIIDYLDGRVEDMRFNAAGEVVEYGLEPAELEALINEGTPFRTSGCPGRSDQDTVSACTRPYGDSSPTDIMSFPFALNERDVAVVRRQMAGESVGTFDHDAD
ncbi:MULTISPECIES: radical SAM protein [unclassified Ectothiorhodospira]|uniref:radical SAM protein n=1 Tax=unclassified Ectothiorhodospira TaxID=2684909 RepID=UPI001EE86AEB|nr:MULTISPECIES: radical SAM protein [unclassified Ectothiorhodospira]MCG5517274.1 radical SAM protein [Ectothiorhodospira sp. 9100]MCG5520181.1 radical SAM protein [Ectothiorhodospira sp. 9905]